MYEKNDIFDRIMQWGFLKRFYPVYVQYKEILLYLFFGGLTFIVSIASYAFFELAAGFTPLIANVFSWVLAVSFAYITNRIWVFEDTASGLGNIIREIASFFGGRLLTLAIEEVILLVGIVVLMLNSILVKVIAQIVVIVLNYFISKLFIFNTKKAEDKEETD